MTDRIAALAGATGFLGRRLAPALAARGWRVRALVRRAADEAEFRQLGFATVRGDLSDSAALADFVAGADVVINCAGLIKSRDPAEFFAVNRDGAERLAMASSGRTVLISSLAARAPELSAYAASKKSGEDAVREAAGDRLVIVRPPVIYGPGDRETLALFRVAGRWPLTPVPGGARVRLAFAHADDVADAVMHVVERSDLSGVYAVGGDRPAGYDPAEIVTEACHAMGKTPRRVAVPAWVVMAAAAASEGVGMLSPSPPIFTRAKARELLHADWSVDPGELAPDTPPARYSLQAGFTNTVAWYRGAGWL